MCSHIRIRIDDKKQQSQPLPDYRWQTDCKDREYLVGGTDVGNRAYICGPGMGDISKINKQNEEEGLEFKLMMTFIVSSKVTRS